MDRPLLSTSHLANGLRRLVADIAAPNGPTGSGLSDVICAESDLISFGDQQIRFCGIDVCELANEHSFESVIWLLLNGDLPTLEELSDACAVMSESAVVEPTASETVAGLPLRTRPLDLLPLSISLISYFDPTPADRTTGATHSRVWRVLAQLPVLFSVAFGQPLDDGRATDPQDGGGLSFAGSLLQVLRSDQRPPSPREEAAMNAVLTCQCLTEMRPACFAARVVGSTVNDVVCALRASASLFVAQLHNDPYQWTAEKLSSFPSPQHAEVWWKSRKSRGMPFGFSGANDDPRPRILKAHCRELLGCATRVRMEAAAARLERLMENDQQQYPTMDWTAARLLALLDVPPERISLAIGMARLAGWAAHAIEHHASGVSLLPSLRYASE
ncbi:MAG: citrate/2-methylcitrate synthase [Planctomycetaceae bacterium]